MSASPQPERSRLALAAHQRRARAVGFCGDGHGDPVVPPRVDPARRISRRVLAADDRHPGRHRRGSLASEFPEPPRGPAGRVADGRCRALFVAFALLGLAIADASVIGARRDGRSRVSAALGGATDAEPSGLATRTLREFWFNTRPILLEAGDPGAADGFRLSARERPDSARGADPSAAAPAFSISPIPPAPSAARLAAGFLLLPALGIQGSATVLMIGGALAIVPLVPGDAAGTRARPGSIHRGADQRSGDRGVAAAASGLRHRPGAGAPARRTNGCITLQRGPHRSRRRHRVAGQGRTLLTNGHPMSSTTRLSQRYMRALAHIPLLAIDDPETVLVIGFGVGNTTHAATLHPSIRRVEVADLSRGYPRARRLLQRRQPATC